MSSGMRTGKYALWAVIAAGCFATSSWAQDDDPPGEWVRWDGVQRFVGVARLETRSSRDETGPDQDDHSRENNTVTLTFELEREEPDGYGGSTIWNATRAHVEGWLQESARSASYTNRGSYSESGSYSLDLDPVDHLEQVHLILNHETGAWQFMMPSNVPPYQTQRETSHWTLAENRTERTSRTMTYTSVPGTSFDGAAGREIEPLFSHYENAYREEDGSGSASAIGHVTLLPEWADLEVIVTLEGYNADGSAQPFEDWRPLGSLQSPGMRGNYVDAVAVLRPKSGAEDKPLPKVERFRFELLGTSREPGVAMNWPLDAKDSELDMRMTLARDAGEIDADGQAVLVPQPRKDANGRPTAEVRIDSYDFGGITELRVIAELADGRRIFGKLDLGGTEYSDILVPKRVQGGWVADAWRDEQGVSNLFDDDDGEEEPAGDGDDGDGYTLYEEYRGFAVRRMRGGRVEGDPKRKDFFILNLIGSDAWAGLHLFEDATGLRVVHRLETTEMSEEKRLMNGNRAAGPHRVDQHGVVLKILTADEIGHHGAQAIAIAGRDSKKALKPRTTRVVALPARDDPDSDLNNVANLVASDFERSWDITIEHELLHSIGVQHHGAGDESAYYYYIPASFKLNRAGVAVLWRYTSTTWRPVEVVEEATGRRWIDKIAPAYEAMLERVTAAHVAATGKPAGTRFADFEFLEQYGLMVRLPPFLWNQGKEHGQHSGDEYCPMRYRFALIYLAKNFGAGPQGFKKLSDEVYYLAPQNSEHHGPTICEAPTGTGVNAIGRQPEPRYGDAAEKRGNCAEQICLNDAMEEHPRGLRQ